MVNGQTSRGASAGTLLLTRSDVARLLDMSSCIQAVEDGFRALADPHRAQTAILGLHVARGGFHAKAATLVDPVSGAAWFAAKLNANFPGNPRENNLPTIQGVLALFDAHLGTPVALMDSIELTILRTAAATAVAARCLAAPDATEVAIVGCGAQAQAQLHALRAVRPVTRVRVFDSDHNVAERFARTTRKKTGLVCIAADTLSAATLGAHIIVTCTPARTPFLRREHLSNGVFIAAVGADNEDKSEIDPALMAQCALVVDSLEQCMHIGDLHHAIAAGTMSGEAVRAALSEVIGNPACGRRSSDEIVVFDSTGVAIQDVAAAAMLYHRAIHGANCVRMPLDQ
ncbi:MAG: ornithine cyclodeaminase family protein [Gemmatimonadaceae bacterium]